MRVFCNQCGAANEGEPGTKVMCVRCTSVFEVPGNFSPTAAAPSPATPTTIPPQPATLPDPNSDAWVPPWASNPQATPTAPQPGAGAPQPAPGGAQTWTVPIGAVAPGTVATAPVHPLAIVSLVLGIIGFACCLIGPVAALVTGGLAISKIDANPAAHSGRGLAIGGMILGGIELAFSFLSFVLAMLGGHH